MAVLGIGEGWTGAMVPGELNQRIRGHFDEAEVDLPVVMYDQGPVHAVRPGWGHTALIVPSDDGDSSSSTQLLLTGRPYDFPNLLRLYRMPAWIRRHAGPRGGVTHGHSLHPSVLFGRALTWLVEQYQSNSAEDRALLQDWEAAEAYSLLTAWTPLPTPEAPAHLLACGAGVSAFGTASGQVYSFGMNGFGQCGVGLQGGVATTTVATDDEEKKEDAVTLSHVVWSPSPIVQKVILPDGEENVDEEHQEESVKFSSFALGLQHGIGLDVNGQVFCWGKGERGQLGQDYLTTQAPSSLIVPKAYTLSERQGGRQKPIYREIGEVVQVDAGMVHSAALTVDNEVLLWGKHVIPPLPNDAALGRTASDSKIPCLLTGLPDKTILQISCGSHHTSILFDDGSVYGVGLSTDTKVPLHEPVELIPPGVVDLPVRQFASHMDRTTVVGADGRQVWQVHLWEDPELRDYALFTPGWVDRLLEEDSSVRIAQVHRSWLHTVILTDD